MRVDWTLSDERVFHSASLIIVPGYNYTCEGPEDNHLFRAGLLAQVGGDGRQRGRRRSNVGPVTRSSSLIVARCKVFIRRGNKNVRKSLHLISNKTSKCGSAGSTSPSR